MAVSNPRSRFGFELVEQSLYIPALLNILCPPILLSHQLLPLLQCARASWFGQFEPQKSVGDDTWQLMPDWTQGVPRPPSLLCRTSPYSYWSCSLAGPIYCPSTMTNRTVRHMYTLSLGFGSNFDSWARQWRTRLHRIFEIAVPDQ
jgi:hypothetical protein